LVAELVIATSPLRTFLSDDRDAAHLR